MKACTRCHLAKPTDEYNRDASRSDGLMKWCRTCHKAQRAKNYQANRTARLAKCKEWREKNPEKQRAAVKRWTLANKDRVAACRARYLPKKRKQSRDYYQINRERILERTRARYHAHRCEIYARRKANAKIRIATALRIRLHGALRRRSKRGSAVRLLGCSVVDLISHLERLFQPGMSWQNYGRAGWHIDHIVPLSSFDLTDPDQLAKACHYTNLQPLWAKENLSKGAHH